MPRILIPLLLSLLLAACGEAREGETAVCGPPDLSRVTLVVGDQARLLSLLSAPSQALADTPYRIEWAHFQSPAPLFEAFKSGAVDIAPAIDNLILAAAINHTPLKIVATSRDRSARGTAILARADSDVRDIADLKGRQVMVSTIKGGTADNLLQATLAQAGLDEKDLSIGYLLRSDAFAAFSSGHAELWVTDDPYTARAEALGARVLRTAEGVNRGLTFYAAGQKALDNPCKRLALADFLQRLQRAADWNQAHPRQYAGFYAAQTGLEPAIAASVLERRGATRFQAIGRDTLEHTAALAREYARRGLFEMPAAIDVFFDASLLHGSPLAEPHGRQGAP